MKFFLVWQSGSCNMGDHTSEFNEFDTLAEAQAEADRLSEHYGVYDRTYMIVEGTVVMSKRYEEK